MSAAQVHAVLAGCWMILAVVLAVHTALLGNEESVLAKQRGADLKSRTDLRYRYDRLRTAVDWQASPPVLLETMKRLDLLPQPTVPPAAQPQGGTVATRR